MGKGVEVRARSIRLHFTFQGRRHRKTLMLQGAPMQPTPANVKYAHRLASEIESRIAHGSFSMAEYFPASGSGSLLTVGEQLDLWLVGQRITASTRASYESAIRFWKGTAIGPVSVRSLLPSQCKAALAERPLLSGKTVNNYTIVLRRALGLAVEDRMLTENPAERIPRAKHQKPPVDPFTREEAEAIVADMAKRYDAQVANYAEFKFFTGLRTGESFGLRWPSIDMQRGEVLVHEGVVRGVETDRTKTDRARLVKLNSRARAVLERQRAHTLLAGEHVFLDPRYGKRWADERAFRRSFWAPTLKRLGIRYRQPYNTRHTYATMMLMAGMEPAFCAGQMGHSIEVFLRDYTKWIAGAADVAEMSKLEAVLSPDCPQDRVTRPKQ